MSIDLNNPLYAQLISQGRAGGYNDNAIAAAIGNASVENGGKTDGTPGDLNAADGLGGAFGGFQWRGPRHDNLKTYAGQQGTTWTDPATQAGYFYGEMGGKYPNAGVGSWVNDQFKNAEDLDTGVDAMVDYLKPKGWNGGDDNAHTVPTYSPRLAAAQEALKAIQAQGGPGNLQAPNSGDAAGQGTPGGAGMLYAGPQVARTTPAPLQLPSTSAGQRLMLAGAALMARDNPGGASALSGMVSSERNNDLQIAQLQASQAKQAGQQPTWTDRGIVGDGKYRMQVDDLGNQRYVPVPQAAQDTVEAEKAKKADMLQFQTNAGQLSDDRQIINTANQLKENLLNGKLNVKATSQGVALVQNYTGTSGPNARDLKNMEALINVQIRNILAQEKGPATQMKIKQAMQQVLPSGGQWDDTQVYDALDRMTGIMRENYTNVANTNRAYAKMYPGMTTESHGIDGKPLDLGATYDADLSKWQGQQDDHDKRKAAFYARHDAQAGNPGAPPSFLSFFSSFGH